jgi:hypothetical protein
MAAAPGLCSKFMRDPMKTNNVDAQDMFWFDQPALKVHCAGAPVPFTLHAGEIEFDTQVGEVYVLLPR